MSNPTTSQGLSALKTMKVGDCLDAKFGSADCQVFCVERTSTSPDKETIRFRALAFGVEVAELMATRKDKSWTFDEVKA